MDRTVRVKRLLARAAMILETVCLLAGLGDSREPRTFLRTIVDRWFCHWPRHHDGPCISEYDWARQQDVR